MQLKPRLTLAGFILLLFAVLLPACSASQPPAQDPAPATGAPQVQIAVFNAGPGPLVAGDANLNIAIFTPDGKPLQGASVSAAIDMQSMPGMPGYPLSAVASEQGNGLYALHAAFDMPGEWLVSVHVKKDSLDFQGDVPVSVK
jgi:hypothetical protein